MTRDPLAGRLPVTVVTGFLGSGKTTLIRRLLAPSGHEPGGGDRQRVRRGRHRPRSDRGLVRERHPALERLSLLRRPHRPAGDAAHALRAAPGGRSDRLRPRARRDERPRRPGAGDPDARHRHDARCALPARRGRDAGRRGERTRPARPRSGGGEAGRARRPPADHQDRSGGRHGVARAAARAQPARRRRRRRPGRDRPRVPDRHRSGERTRRRGADRTLARLGVRRGRLPRRRRAAPRSRLSRRSRSGSTARSGGRRSPRRWSSSLRCVGRTCCA